MKINSFREVECLECGELFPQTRSDKKFCCVQHKNRFNNRVYRAKEKKIFGDKDSAGHKSRDILDKHFPYSKGKNKLDLYQLQAEGLDTTVSTNIVIENNKRIIFLYDYCYEIINNESIIIYKSNENL